MSQSIKTVYAPYESQGLKFSSYVAYDSADNNPRPVVMIVHEWWGLNDYIKSRARQLAELGYFAVAVDMYGDGKTAQNVQEAMNLSGPFYQNAALAKERFDFALSQLGKYNDVADKNKVAAIGYCFGGSMVLNFAKMGEDLKGVVSFHGGLSGLPAEKNKIKGSILVCHGKDDKFVKPAEIASFKNQMDSVGADYSFKEYSGATHAFSNPDATEWGKKFNIPIAYNASADSSSWDEMKKFFERIFQ